MLFIDHNGEKEKAKSPMTKNLRVLDFVSQCSTSEL